jgi:hypothetical protein
VDPSDFYDVPSPALSVDSEGSRDRFVSIAGDVAALLAYFGTTTGNPPYSDDQNENGIADGLEYDRRPSTFTAQHWKSGAPDGSITIAGDVAVMLGQFAHTCL